MLALPTDRPRPALQTFTGGVEQFGLSRDLTSRLRALGRDTGASLFMGFLATLATLLSRYSGQEEVCVGCPVENRPFGETSRLIGLFVNTLPLRIAVNERATFGELLRQIRDFSLEAFERQDVPLETLVERLATERTPGASPLFQVALSWLDGRKGFATLPGLQSAPFEFAHRCVKFDLDLEVYETNEDLRVSWFYNTALFDTATIRRMIGHFTQLLAAVVASPARPLAELEMLPAAERAVLLTEWSGAGAVGEATGTVPARFERVVARDPTRLALVAEGGTLTYGELNRRADHLAAVLRTHGVRPGLPVGLCAARSVELIVAMVAILKAGGTYVPLDPAHPPERLAALLADVAAPLVLTHGPGLPLLPPACTALPIAAAERAGGAAAATPAAAPGDPAAVAYVMYTSGSTGTPKGVRVPHRAILRLVCEPTYVTLDATETLLQLAPTAFDAATFEIWGALLNGARLVLAPPAPPTLAELGALIRTHGITTLWLTASLFHLMVDERLADLAPLRQLLAGGDVLSVPHVRRAVAALRHGRLINGYGPTENTTFTCCQVVDAATAALPAIPIGRPIGGTTVYVLDPQRRPVPVGVAGELYTGGLGLALDYLRRPDLTAARFVPHPFADGRLYRTGDRVRWRPDGTLEFLGRFDDQLKIRGFRIEPAEVAAALASHPAVIECCVVAVDQPSSGEGEKTLVAYYVSRTPVDELALRQHLATRLPAPMIPACFRSLERLPMTPHGKVDRLALPAPDRARSDAGEYVAARTSTEREISRIWSSVLGIDRIGVHDTFFALGGHSLAATKVAARMSEAFGVDLPLAVIFRKPTIAALAATLEYPAAAAPAVEQLLAEIERISDDEAREHLQS
jgi:aspartate racemase